MFEKFKRIEKTSENDWYERALLAGTPPGGIYIPTAEWINLYAGLSDDQKRAMEAQFEPPAEPVVLPQPDKPNSPSN